MNCPKCGKSNFKDYCIVCGYMKNGNYIGKTKSENSDLEIMLGYEYDDIIHNTNNLKVFLLGGLYFCYRNCFFVGFFLEILNILFVYFNAYIGSFIDLGSFNFSDFFFLLSIIIEKTFWVMFANQLYIKCAKRKLNRWKKKYSLDEYKMKIANQNIKKFLLPVFAVLLYIFILFIVVIIYRYQRHNLLKCLFKVFVL